MSKIALVILCICPFLANAQQILTLEKALETAELHSPDLKRSLLNLERLQHSLNAQKASLKSKFSLTLNPFDYNQNRNYNDYFTTWNTNKTFSTSGTFTVAQPILPTDGTISLVDRFGWQDISSKINDSRDKSFSNNLYLRYSQPIFTYNRRKLELNELELEYENANLSYAIQKLNVEKNVTQYFYNVYLAQMSLSISRDEFENTQKTYNITKNKVEAGIAAKEELYQAELNLATAKSDMQNSEVNLENAKDLLKQYIGMDIMEQITVMTDILAEPIKIDLQAAINYGTTNRLELRQREIDIENSQFALIRTSALNEFYGNIDLSIGLTGDDERFENMYENPSRNPKVAVSFNIPLWDWGEQKSRINAQKAAIKRVELNATEEKKQIIIDIRKVHRNLINLKNQIEIAQQSEKNAQLTYEINQERYANGDLTSMDLNLFQTQLSEKKNAYANSLINYKLELLNMKIQTLYDFVRGKTLVPSEIINNDF